MARPLRIVYPGACYHVTARGNARRPIFADDVDRRRFLERLAVVVTRYRLVLHAYVLMRNHYHLLVETPDANLPRAIRQLNGVYTQDFNRRHRRVGHLLQGRYNALLVERDAYLAELSRYIHLNPVRVGEVREPAAFRWSSAAAYVGARSAEAYLHREAVLAQFGRRPQAACARYRAFLAEGMRDLAEKPWGRVVGQTLLGTPRWVERMRRRAETVVANAAEVPAARELRRQPPLSAVIAQVCRLTRVPRAAVVERAGGHGGWPRAAAMYLAWRLCGLTQRAIGQEFGVGDFAVSKAMCRVEALRHTDPNVARTIDRIITALQT